MFVKTRYHSQRAQLNASTTTQEVVGYGYVVNLWLCTLSLVVIIYCWLCIAALGSNGYKLIIKLIFKYKFSMTNHEQSYKNSS